MKYAAIDIGSNAVRLMIIQAMGDGKNTYFKKVSLVRVPLRLGHDAFTSGKITPHNITSLIKTLQAFKNLMEVHKVKHTMACATSALREARNGKTVVATLRRRTGINVQIVSGQREAEILYGTHIAEKLGKNRSFLYIDIGGGSTELTVFTKGKRTDSASFNLGTIRILEGREPSETWQALKDWLQIARKKLKGNVIGIGTGGNVTKLYRLSKLKKDQLLTYPRIRDLLDELEMYTVAERMHHFSLNPDRADVIVPAAKILLWVMKWARVKDLHVPNVGLVDGMVGLMHDRFK